ncbi:MAG: IS3 family transposase [Planctomycetota bacterium]
MAGLEARDQSASVVRARQSPPLDYESRREDPIELREAMAKEAAERPRFGYRRLWIMVQRRGHIIGLWAFYRHYRELGLALRKRKRKRLKGQARAPQVEAERPNVRWSMDFVHDQTAGGRSFRMLNVVDDCTREALAVEVASSLPSGRVIRVLEGIIARRGRPGVIIHDNGPEFVSNQILRWAYERGLKLCPIQPGKPVQNAFVESFNGRLRDECLNQHWFADLEEARELIADWKDDYKAVRPHGSLNGMTPREYAAQFGELARGPLGGPWGQDARREELGTLSS